MARPMQRVSTLISKDIGDYLTNRKAWGPVMYNVLEHGLKGDGATDDTAALQGLVNLAISEGRKAIFFPHTASGGEYYVTSSTNADQVMFFGDNSIFVGGYTGVIRQLGDLATSEQLADTAYLGGSKKDHYDHKAGEEQFFLSRSRRTTRRAMLTITYDDAGLSIYQHAWPVHKQEGVPGIFYVCTGMIDGSTAFDWGALVSWDHIKEMNDYHGVGKMYIGNHSHSHPRFEDSLTDEQAVTDLEMSLEIFAKHGIRTMHFAYPYNNQSLRVRNTLQSYFNSARGGGFLNIRNPYDLRGFGIDDQTVAAIKLQIDSIASNNDWGLFYAHGIHPSKSTGGRTVLSPAELTEIIQYAKSKGVEIVSIDEGLRAVSPDFYANDGATEKVIPSLESVEEHNMQSGTQTTGWYTRFSNGLQFVTMKAELTEVLESGGALAAQTINFPKGFMSGSSYIANISLLEGESTISTPWNEVGAIRIGSQLTGALRWVYLYRQSGKTNFQAGNKAVVLIQCMGRWN